jgi:hypothetical protein
MMYPPVGKLPSDLKIKLEEAMDLAMDEARAYVLIQAPATQ